MPMSTAALPATSSGMAERTPTGASASTSSRSRSGMAAAAPASPSIAATLRPPGHERGAQSRQHNNEPHDGYHEVHPRTGKHVGARKERAERGLANSSCALTATMAATTPIKAVTSATVGNRVSCRASHPRDGRPACRAYATVMQNPMMPSGTSGVPGEQLRRPCTSP